VDRSAWKIKPPAYCDEQHIIAKREELLQAIAHGSAAAWGHLNLLGEYDFSEDKLPARPLYSLALGASFLFGVLGRGPPLVYFSLKGCAFLYLLIHNFRL
jgi:hypothetical protein